MRSGLSCWDELVDAMSRRREAWIVLPPPSAASHVKVFEDVFPSPTGEESPASAARGIAIDRLRAGLRFDYSINCLASRAIQQKGYLVLGIDNSCTLGTIPSTPKLTIRRGVGKEN